MPPFPTPAWYAPFYCEENVWRLLRDNPAAGGDAHALFISNTQRACPVWSQRAAPSETEPVLWDYHVVMLGRDATASWNIWDLDSTLGCPVPAEHYLAGTFPLAGALQPALEPWFRLVPAPLFLSTFASDRSHMRLPNGGWTHPPPSQPAIRTADAVMNLWDFVDVDRPFVGTVLDFPGLLQRVAATD